MDKPKNLYEVSGSGGRTLHVQATSNDQAKRAYCNAFGIRYNSYWSGARSLKARKLKPDEVKAWEEQAETNRATFIFIKGMMDIYAKAYEVSAAKGDKNHA